MRTVYHATGSRASMTKLGALAELTGQEIFAIVAYGSHFLSLLSEAS